MRPSIEDAPPPLTLRALVRRRCRSRSSSCWCSAASTAACSRPPKARPSARPPPSSTALLKGEMTWQKFKDCFYGTAVSAGDDLPDLPRRRPDELGAGADAGAQPAGRRGGQLGRVAAAGGGGDPAVLRGARRGDGRAVDAAADHPDLLPDGHGAGLRHAQGVGGDLVRHHGADDGGLRPDRAAGGPERLHRQRPGQGRADGRDLPRRHALPGQRRAAHRCCSCSFPIIPLWLVGYQSR